METLLTYKSGAVLAIFVSFTIAERLFALARRPQREGRAVNNLALFAINIAVSVGFVIPLTAAATELGPNWRPAWWSGLGAFAVDLLILDLWSNLWHRCYHEIPLLWRLHRVHHRDVFLDTTSAVRFHFLEVAISALVRALVLIACDIPLLHVLIIETIFLVAAIFQHSNIALPKGVEQPLSRLLVTPSHHWVHHHAVRSDTDSNYGLVFSFWDRLFGTLSLTVRWPAMPIGIEGVAKDTSLPGLLLYPFQRGSRGLGQSGDNQSEGGEGEAAPSSPPSSPA